MSADIIDLAIKRDNKPLTDLTDPCSICDDKPGCTTTCKRANAWWDQFTVAFKRRAVINKLGGK